MKKIKYFSALVLFSIFLAAGCYQAPSANSSRSSGGGGGSTGATTPVAEKSAQPSPSAQNSPVKTGGNFEQSLSDYNAKNYDRAESGFKEVVQGEPNNAEAHYYLGNIYYRRQQFDAALPHFEQAAKIDFKSVDKLMAWGETQRALQQFDRAIVQYQKAVGFDPNNANAYYGLGLTYLGLNNEIAARQQLQKLEPLNKALAEKLQAEIDKSKKKN